ncbi:MAG: hypothetical protein ACOX3S_03590 [Anaerolineae bacterium]|jgi:hypothetical protein
MPKLATALIALTLALALTACRAAAPAATPAVNDALPADYDGALPALSQLLVGTFRLEGQPQAVTAEQAPQLALLWRGYRALSQSDATAPLELQSLQKQLYEAMTAAQLEAIAGLRLTTQDMMALMAEQGVEAGAGASAQLTDEQRARIEALRQAGASQGGGAWQGRGEGVRPDGGGGFVQQGGPPPEMGAMGGPFGGAFPGQQGNADATTLRTRAMVPSGLLDKVIALLENK